MGIRSQKSYQNYLPSDYSFIIRYAVLCLKFSYKEIEYSSFNGLSKYLTLNFTYLWRTRICLSAYDIPNNINHKSLKMGIILDPLLSLFIVCC